MVFVFVANIEQMLLVDEGKGHPRDAIGKLYDVESFKDRFIMEDIKSETHVIKFIKFEAYRIPRKPYSIEFSLKPETKFIVRHSVQFYNVEWFVLNLISSNELAEFKKFLFEQQSIAINRIIARERNRDTRFKFNCATVNDRITLKARFINKLDKHFHGHTFDEKGNFLNFDV